MPTVRLLCVVTSQRLVSFANPRENGKGILAEERRYAVCRWGSQNKRGEIVCSESEFFIYSNLAVFRHSDRSMTYLKMNKEGSEA